MNKEELIIEINKKKAIIKDKLDPFVKDHAVKMEISIDDKIYIKIKTDYYDKFLEEFENLLGITNYIIDLDNDPNWKEVDYIAFYDWRFSNKGIEEYALAQIITELNDGKNFIGEISDCYLIDNCEDEDFIILY